MAVVIGTNAGFVLVSPTVDPEGSEETMSDWSYATKCTSPPGSNIITEIGWYCSNATNDTNFEVGIYEHDSINDKPDAALFLDKTNAKGADAGWKKVTGLNISISPNTIYWIANQLDPTAMIMANIDISNPATRTAVNTGQGELTDPGNFGAVFSKPTRAIYAVYKSIETRVYKKVTLKQKNKNIPLGYLGTPQTLKSKDKNIILKKDNNIILKSEKSINLQ